MHLGTWLAPGPPQGSLVRDETRIYVPAKPSPDDARPIVRLQVQSQKPSAAMMKLALMRTATGRPRVTSAVEDKFIRVNGPSYCSPMLHRVQ